MEAALGVLRTWLASRRKQRSLGRKEINVSLYRVSSALAQCTAPSSGCRIAQRGTSMAKGPSTSLRFSPRPPIPQCASRTRQAAHWAEPRQPVQIIYERRQKALSTQIRHRRTVRRETCSWSFDSSISHRRGPWQSNQLPGVAPKMHAPSNSSLASLGENIQWQESCYCSI